MIFYKIALFLFLIFIPYSSVIAQTQAAINAEAKTQFELSKQKLESVYIAILNKYEDNPEFNSSLKKAQDTWLKFRDAHLDSVYPGKNKRSKYGSVYPSCVSILLVQLNNQRIEQLRIWLDGTEEGDVCAGSIKLSSKLE